MLQCAKEAGLSIAHVCALTHAGCLDEFGKQRTLLVYSAQLFNILTDKEKRLVTQYGEKFDYRLPQLILAMVKDLKDEKSRPLIKESRFQTIRSKMEKYKAIYKQNSESESFCAWYFQNALLGYSFDYTLMDIFSKFNGRLKSIRDVLSEPDKTHCEFVCKIEEGPTLSKSKNGNAYAKYIVSDETSSVKIMIFGDRLEKCKELNTKMPDEGVIIVKGTKMDSSTVFADLISLQQNKIFVRYADVKEEE